MSDELIRALYRERAVLVANLSTRYPSVIAYNDPELPGWPVIYISTPKGQLSWHISRDDLHLFNLHIVDPRSTHAQWDGHTTAEKYSRLEELNRSEGHADFPGTVTCSTEET